MIRKVFYVALLGLMLYEVPCRAQGLNIGPGGYLVASGAPSIVLNNADLINDGMILPSVSNFIFRGNASNIDVSGTGNTSFYNLTMNKAANNLALNAQISVNNNLTMTNGNIDLNGNNIILNSNAQIVGEDASSYITGTSGGYVQMTVNLNAPVAQNPGNMGFEITSPANLGSTVITRSHVQQTSATGYGINRFYEVTPTNNAGLNASVVFHYLDNELAGITESELNLWRSPNSGTTWDLLGVDALNTTTNELTKNNVHTMGRFTAGSVLNNPLPIRLLSFTGQLVNRQTQLQWKMSNEEAVSYYELQRSADGNDFSVMKKLSANGSLHYTEVDPIPLSGYNYYRLKIFTKANEISYSNMVKVYLNDNGTVSVYPNPATDKVFIEFTANEDMDAMIKLTDETGKLVETKTARVVKGKNKISWDLQPYAKAVYYLHLDELNYSAIKITKL